MESINKYVWYQEKLGVMKKQHITFGVKLLNVANMVDERKDFIDSNFISQMKEDVI